ncbi:cytochrome P450 [Gloeopeniophorella convolvens]|nr:cytochrome P450 [Gloeopeniophorella convolvens]
MLVTSSIDVARQVVSGGAQSPWIKPESASGAILLWGMNLIASEKDTWRRHRRIMGPAFNSTTYAFVWAETRRIYRDMVVTEGWESKTVVDIKSVQDYTFRVALFVISACGFGVTFHWDEPPVGEDGAMGVQKALRIFAETPGLQAFAPEWVFKLPVRRFREIGTSKKVLTEYLAKQISERKAELAGVDGLNNRTDVFSLLVKASEDDGKLKMDDTELVGNVFGILFAGHETTAHTLAATLGFLGIHPEIQKEVYEQIVDIVGLERDPAFDDFVKLEKVANVFYEALRLFPAGYLMIREAIEDTTLTILDESQASGTRTVPVQKGFTVAVDMTGVQYNPRYFPEPYKFDPNRWRGVTTEAEDVTAFSVAGPRTCLGRKFAAVEAVCFLTLFLRDWKVEPALNPEETGEQWRERIMQAEVLLTLGVKPVPVRLTRLTGSG